MAHVDPSGDRCPLDSCVAAAGSLRQDVTTGSLRSPGEQLRKRASPPGGGPCYPPAVRRVTVLALIALLLIAACSEAASSEAPSQLETLTPIDEPIDEPTEEPLPTEPPPIEPVESFPTEAPPITPEPGPEESFPTEPPVIEPEPGRAGPATDCSDNAKEQEFWAKVVAAMDWDVYCPGLPAGWAIGADGGLWRSAGVGYAEISYRMRSGPQLKLSEGAYCQGADGCAPAGDEVGSASFGGLVGTLIAGSDGSWAVVADPDAEVSYLLVGQSIDEATFRELAAGMIRVEP